MTPKEEAIQLVNKFEDYVFTDYRYDEEPVFEMQKNAL